MLLSLLFLNIVQATPFNGSNFQEVAHIQIIRGRPITILPKMALKPVAFLLSFPTHPTPTRLNVHSFPVTQSVGQLRVLARSKQN